MRALVTGGAGFIGTNLIIRLLRDGHEVISLDNYSLGYSENEQEGCHYINGDAKDMELWGSTFEIEDMIPDVIFHLGALSSVQPSLLDPKGDIDNNVNSTLSVLEWARKHKIQVVYAGSSSYQGGIHTSPYAWSKYAGEDLCKLYSKVYDLNTSICRFYNVYGLYHVDEGDYATVIAIWEKQFLNKKPLTITGDGEQRRDFTHVDDIVDGLIKCVGKDLRADVFNLGSGVSYSINELANQYGIDYPKKYIGHRDGEYPETLADSSFAEQVLGWKSKLDIKDYITKWVGVNKNV